MSIISPRCAKRGASVTTSSDGREYFWQPASKPTLCAKVSRARSAPYTVFAVAVSVEGDEELAASVYDSSVPSCGCDSSRSRTVSSKVVIGSDGGDGGFGGQAAKSTAPGTCGKTIDW